MKQLKLYLKQSPHLQYFYFALGLFLLLLGACTDSVQQNDVPPLASKDGGTTGGPIQGSLRIQVFDRISRTPASGVLVMLGNAQTATTDFVGIVEFGGVFGPQDIHVFACRGCSGTQQEGSTPLLFQNTSYYQINAANIAIPISGRVPSQSNGLLVGKVFEGGLDDKVYVLSTDDQGGINILPPLRTVSHQWVRREEIATPSLPPTFVHTKDLDDWAAATPELGRQAFNRVALIGKVVSASGAPQGGVRVVARYFNGTDPGTPVYFNSGGVLDTSLTATSSDGRFVFLRLIPGQDLFVEADSLGIGVGATNVRLPNEGAITISFPIFPLLQNTVEISGRVVNYQLNFREEEEKNGTSGTNIPIDGAQILFSADDFSQFTTAGSAPILGGQYQAKNPLLQNGEYITAVFGGNTFRPTHQVVSTGIRSKIINYPLAAVPQSQLVDILRVGTGDPDIDLLDSNAELIGRIVQETNNLDQNGDPILSPAANVTVSILGNDGTVLTDLFYLDSKGFIDKDLQTTSSSGGFVYYSLVDNPNSTSEITVTATSGTDLLRRQTVFLTFNTARLLDMVVTLPVPSTPLERAFGPVSDLPGNPVSGIFATLIGGLSSATTINCPELNPDVGNDCVLHGEGDYLIRMERETGGGDYGIAFDGAAKRLSLTTFRLSPSAELNGAQFLASIDPRNTFNLQNDLDMSPIPGASEAGGLLTLPGAFILSDVKTVLIGSVRESGRVVLGVDPKALSGQAVNPYRMPTLLDPLAKSYFIRATAQNSDGEESMAIVQGLKQIPSAQNLSFAAPPRLSVPFSGETNVGNTPHIVWSAPSNVAVDFYRVQLLAEDGDRLWEAFVPGDIKEITLPSVPSEAPAQLNVLQAGKPVRLVVRAIQAGGLSLNQFNFKQLVDRLVGDSADSLIFTP